VKQQKCRGKSSEEVKFQIRVKLLVFTKNVVISDLYAMVTMEAIIYIQDSMRLHERRVQRLCALMKHQCIVHALR
jgi:hypothetical protein